MPVERVIYLPEAVIEDLLGRRLVRDVPQLFEYNGALYRARPKDPLLPDDEVQCELVEAPRRKHPRGRSVKRGPSA
ncbi:MAG: hypothetical protein ACLQKK_10145 [Rhodomicrobium sp.]